MLEENNENYASCLKNLSFQIPLFQDQKSTTAYDQISPLRRGERGGIMRRSEGNGKKGTVPFSLPC